MSNVAEKTHIAQGGGIAPLAIPKESRVEANQKNEFHNLETRSQVLKFLIKQYQTNQNFYIVELLQACQIEPIAPKGYGSASYFPKPPKKDRKDSEWGYTLKQQRHDNHTNQITKDMAEVWKVFKDFGGIVCKSKQYQSHDYIEAEAMEAIGSECFTSCKLEFLPIFTRNIGGVLDGSLPLSEFFNLLQAKRTPFFQRLISKIKKFFRK